MSLLIESFVVEGLGNSAYLVGSQESGGCALIDPMRDVDAYLEAANAAGLSITHIFETHLHADFVSGSRELAARTGAPIYASAQSKLQFDHIPLKDGDTVIVGDLKIGVLETPGHTPEHLSFTVTEPGAERPKALFSGGSLLVGAVARTDLLSPEMTRPLTRQLHETLRRKIMALPDDVEVYPTHGAGSFCTVDVREERTTTIGRERLLNPLLQIEAPEAFVEAVLARLSSYPAYFRRLRAVNQQGPRILGDLPRLVPLSPEEVSRQLQSGALAIDTRSPQDFARGHIPTSYGVPLRPAFATWVGWVIPDNHPLIIVSKNNDVHQEIVRQLVRIGYDHLAGYLEGGIPAWIAAGMPVAQIGEITTKDVRKRLKDLTVLDVRQDDEWAAGHIPGAMHIEAGQLQEKSGDLPPGKPIATHCGHDLRATTALSLLERTGFRDLYLIRGGWEAWQEAGHEVERPSPALE